MKALTCESVSETEKGIKGADRLAKSQSVIQYNRIWRSSWKVFKNLLQLGFSFQKKKPLLHFLL